MLEVYDYMIADKELELVTTQVTSLPIKMTERNLQKVLSNLIGNGVKYSPAGGKITITSTSQSWEIRNQVSNLANLKNANIFEPFISYDRDNEDEVEKGHGLGLYIVAAILNQSGYTFEKEVDEAKAEFIFRINLGETAQELT